MSDSPLDKIGKLAERLTQKNAAPRDYKAEFEERKEYEEWHKKKISEDYENKVRPIFHSAILKANSKLNGSGISISIVDEGKGYGHIIHEFYLSADHIDGRGLGKTYVEVGQSGIITFGKNRNRQDFFFPDHTNSGPFRNISENIVLEYIAKTLGIE